MGLLRRITEPFTMAATLPAADYLAAPLIESPWADSANLQAVTLAGLFDQVDSLPLGRDQAIRIPSLARARDLICCTTARMPLYAVTKAGRLDPQPRAVARPEAGRARYTTLVWTVDALLFYGRAWWLVTKRYAEDNRPMTFRWVPEWRAEVDNDGRLVTAFDQPVSRQSDVIRFDGPHEGILTRGIDGIRDARNISRAYSKAAKTPTPYTELHQTAGDPLTPDQVKELVGYWVKARQGENGGVAYTNASVEARMHGQPAELLLTQGRDAARLDVAHLCGLPAWAVDASVNGSSLTYSNVPARSRELIDYTLSGYMESITGRLSLDDVLAAGTWAEFDTTPLESETATGAPDTNTEGTAQ